MRISAGRRASSSGFNPEGKKRKRQNPRETAKGEKVARLCDGIKTAEGRDGT